MRSAREGRTIAPWHRYEATSGNYGPRRNDRATTPLRSSAPKIGSTSVVSGVIETSASAGPTADGSVAVPNVLGGRGNAAAQCRDGFASKLVARLTIASIDSAKQPGAIPALPGHRRPRPPDAGRLTRAIYRSRNAARG